jgi:hypothetical protein
MGLFSKLVGVPDVGNVIEKTGSALDKLFTSKDEKLTHAELMEKIKQNPQEWQAQANNIAAAHRSMFVAGARPFIMWVCGAGLSFVFVFNPIIQWTTGAPGPVMPIDSLMELVVAMLGLGAMRSFEKATGVAK